MYNEKMCNDYTDSLATYYQEVGKFPIIGKEEEKRLFEEYSKTNDSRIRDKIINSNLRFVFKTAKKYRGMGLPMEELVSEGNKGLIKAFSKYKLDKGNRFITYAVWWITDSITNALDCNSKIKDKAGEEELVSMTNPKNNSKKKDTKQIVAVNGGNPLKDYEMFEMKQMVDVILPCLNDKERQVIELYFGLNGHDATKLEDIGKELRLSGERVRQIKNSGMTKMRCRAVECEMDIF